MPKVKIVGMPTIKIIDIPKANVGMEVSNTTTLNLSFIYSLSSTTTMAPVADKPRDINGCIIGEEQYDLATGICVPIDGGYNSKQDENKNKPAVPVTNSSGQVVGGPASTGETKNKTTDSTNTSYSSSSSSTPDETIVKPGDCAKGWYKNSKGECVPEKKLIQPINDIIQASLAAGNVAARVFENAQAKKAAEATMRRKSWSTGVKPGGAMAFGKTQLNEGIEFPNMLTPPNDGQYLGNYFGRTMGQFGGSFPTAASGPIKIKIIGEPDQQVMKYGGQSGYGFDSGWKRSYTEMNKISTDYYKNSMSEDKDSNEEPVLEAEGGETIYKPGDQAFFHLNGDRHYNGGIKLTASQVNSKNKDVPSFIYSDTPSLKIKDKEILNYFGVAPKKGGVTPAEISKKYDINKFKAILEDPNSDNLAKSTAQLMIDKNERRLAELATIQEKMKGLKAPKFAEQTLRQGSAKIGGFMPIYDGGGPIPDPENDPWIQKILEFESKYGSGSGKGLRNWGYNSRIGVSDNNTPNDPTDDYTYDLKDPNKKVSINDAMDYFKEDYLPKFTSYPLELRKRLADYSYNTGRSPEDLMLFAAGKITLDDINSNKTFTKEWAANKDEILKNANDPAFIKKINDAKVQVYKTTGTYDDPNDKSATNKKQIRYSLNNPNPAFGASWSNRINLFDDNGQPVTTTQTANSAPSGASGGNNTVVTSSNTPATGPSPIKAGDWTATYDKLEKVLKDDRNKELRAEIYNRFKKANPKSKVTQEEYIDNLLTAQKHNYAIAAAHEKDPEFLTDPSWDWGDKAVYDKKGKLIHDKGWKNKRYREEVTKLGYKPLDSDGIKQFQQAYRDLEDAMHDERFFESFGKYFKTSPIGVADQTYRGKPISPVDDIYGNTTRGQMFHLSGWVDPTTTMPPQTTIPPTEGPRYICDPNPKGGGTIKKLPPGMTGGYASPEEAAKYCPGPPKRYPYDFLGPDKAKMIATAAVFPRQIFSYIPDMAYNKRPLALEDWRAKAAQRFSTQYAAPSAQLAVYGPTQGLGANLSFLAGQTGQQMAAEDIAPTISRNIDRVNQYNQTEGQRQDQVDLFNLQNKAKRWEGYATTLQNYDNAMRQYLKENSDAFTRAWKNRMHLGAINDTNPNFYVSPWSGRQTWKGNAFYTGVTGDSGTNDVGKMYSLYYKKFMEEMAPEIPDETERKKAASSLAMKQIEASRYSETTDPYTNRTRRRTAGYDFDI